MVEFHPLFSIKFLLGFSWGPRPGVTEGPAVGPLHPKDLHGHVKGSAELHLSSESGWDSGRAESGWRYQKWMFSIINLDGGIKNLDKWMVFP